MAWSQPRPRGRRWPDRPRAGCSSATCARASARWRTWARSWRRSARSCASSRCAPGGPARSGGRRSLLVLSHWPNLHASLHALAPCLQTPVAFAPPSLETCTARQSGCTDRLLQPLQGCAPAQHAHAAGHAGRGSPTLALSPSPSMHRPPTHLAPAAGHAGGGAARPAQSPTVLTAPDEAC